MKIIYALMLVLMAAPVHALTLRTVDGEVQFARWEYCGKPVWTQAEKDGIIAAVATATASDFTDIYPDAGMLTLAQEAQAERKHMTAQQARDELARRNTKPVVLTEILKARREMFDLLQLRTEGFDVSTATATLRSRIELLKQRYQALP